MIRDIGIEERIRRAEQIYARRHENEYSIKRNYGIKDEIKKKKKSRLIKILIQFLCSLGIYLIVGTIQKGNVYINENLNKIIKIEIDVPFYLNKAKEGFFNINQEVLKMLRNKEIESENENQNQNENQNELGNENSKENLAMGGGKEELEITDNNQMIIDADYVKKKCKMIKPLEGIKSSGYGKRKPTDIISENHLGIDLAKEEGSKIIAAISGKVIFSGYSNSFGNYLKIQNDDIVTIYGHCKKLYKKQGEKVSIGEEIGEVGSTGNATGPHLHFEIRRQERSIDPELLLNF